MRRLDEEIKKDIVDQLYWDDRIDASEIKVEVKNGKVILSGSVPSHLARASADTDAWSVSGVLSVDSRIRVQYPKPMTFRSDSQIKSSIEDILEWNSSIDESDIEVFAHEGWVTLEGSVDAFWKKLRAAELAADVVGVVGVTNKLAVVPTQSYTDESIAGDIIAALDRNTNIDAESVNVEVKNGEVTYTGIVRDRTERRGVYELALYTAGVSDIHDDLEVYAA